MSKWVRVEITKTVSGVAYLKVPDNFQARDLDQNDAAMRRAIRFLDSDFDDDWDPGYEVEEWHPVDEAEAQAHKRHDMMVLEFEEFPEHDESMLKEGAPL